MEAMSAIIKSVEVTDIRSVQQSINSFVFLSLSFMSGVRCVASRNVILAAFFVMFFGLTVRSVYFSYLTYHAREAAYRIPSVPIMADVVTMAGALLAIWWAWHPPKTSN